MNKNRSKKSKRKYKKRSNHGDAFNAYFRRLDHSWDWDHGITNNLKVPQGYKAIVESEAIRIFGEPINNTLKDQASQTRVAGETLTYHLWNLSKLYDSEDFAAAETTRYELIDTLEQAGINQPRKTLEALFDSMLERKKTLFPQSIQPDRKPYLFVREDAVQ